MSARSLSFRQGSVRAVAPSGRASQTCATSSLRFPCAKNISDVQLHFFASAHLRTLNKFMCKRVNLPIYFVCSVYVVNFVYIVYVVYIAIRVCNVIVVYIVYIVYTVIVVNTTIFFCKHEKGHSRQSAPILFSFQKACATLFVSNLKYLLAWCFSND